MDLFLATSEMLEKQAVAKKTLSGDPAQQQTEIIDAAYKQHPFLGHYQVDLVESNREPQRGYMYGYLSVVHPRPLPAQAVAGTGVVQNPTVEQDTQNPDIRMIKIPTIVKMNQLYPLDVMITPDEKIVPMTEDRLAVAMKQFQPMQVAPQQQTPAMTAAVPGVSGTDGQPPGGGLGGFMGPNAAMIPAKVASILDSALETVSLEAKGDMLRAFSNDYELQAAYEYNPAFRSSMDKIAAAEPNMQKTASAMLTRGLEGIQPDVLQFRRGKEGSVVIKQAHAGAYRPTFQKIAARDTDILPADLVRALIKEGSVTYSRHCGLNAFPVENTEYTDADTVDTYGALDKVANVHEGVMFPVVLDRTGERVEDRKLFVGDGLSMVSVQEKVAAVAIAPGREMALEILQDFCDHQDPSGYGCFVKFAGADSIVTTPMYIGSRIVANDQLYYSYGTEMGEMRKFAFVEGLNTPRVTAQFDAIPSEWSWLPLPRENTKLMEHPEYVEKAASAELYALSVHVKHSGGSYSLSGPPVDAIPETQRTLIKRADAEFLLATAGANNDNRELLLSRAESLGDASLAVGRVVRPLEMRMKEARAKLAPFAEEIANISPVALLKEAAGLVDQESVDSVLSLGFVTPDNLVGFVDSVETLNQTASRLAEMLLATRMGDLPDIPEVPTERAMKAIEKVVHGLRNLQARLETDEVDADPTQG